MSHYMEWLSPAAVAATLYSIKSYRSEKLRTEERLGEALRELIVLSDAGSLYTAAYQPNLVVDGVEGNGNVANVFLSGSLTFGGVCDVPRFEKQLELTVTQFEGIDFARFYLNGSEEAFRDALLFFRLSLIHGGNN